MSQSSREKDGNEEKDVVVDIRQMDQMTQEEELDALRKALCQTHFEMTSMKLKAEVIRKELLSRDSPNLTSLLGFIDDVLSVPSYIPSILSMESIVPSVVESQRESMPVDNIMYQTNELEQNVDTLRSIVDENGSVIDDLQKMHLESVNDLRQRLQILYSNNQLLTSIIEDNNQHTHELMFIINEKNAEILRLRNSYEDTISSLNSQLLSTQTELKCAGIEQEKTITKGNCINNEGKESQEQNTDGEEHQKPGLDEVVDLQEKITEMEMRIAEIESSSQTKITEIQKEAEMKISEVEQDAETDIHSLEARISEKDAELEYLRTQTHELEKVNESQKMDWTLQRTQLQCMAAVQTTILRVMDRLESRKFLFPHREITSTRPEPVHNYPGPLTVSQKAKIIETPMGSVSTDDPESISRLIKSLVARVKMAEAKVASLERTASRENLLRCELQRKIDEVALLREEMQKSKGGVLDLSTERTVENLSRNNEILKRNELVYLQVLRELKRSVRQKDKQLQELQIILDNIRKSKRLYFVS